MRKGRLICAHTRKQMARRVLSLTLRVFTVQLLGSRNSNEAGGNDSYNAGSSGSMAGVPASGEMNAPVDDLPF